MLNLAAQHDRMTLKLELSRRSQWLATTQARLLSHFLLNRLVMNTPTQGGNLQQYLWNPDPEAKAGALLGEGAYGKVNKFTWFGVECSKKSFHCATEDLKRDIEREAGVMAYLNHPNVVRFFCCHRDRDNWGIVMERMPMDLGAFLADHVPSSRKGFPFTPMAALDMISQIASGMEYLHGQKVVHRDLKPSNILVSPITIPKLRADGYGKVKLCDFGTAKPIVTSRTEQQSRVCGSMAWMAPEAFPRGDTPDMPRGYRTKEADVYSFAIVCSQILSGAHPLPFPVIFAIDLIHRISAPRNERPELPLNTYPPKLLDLIKKCWHPDPQQRPGFSVICKTLQEIKIDLLTMPETSSDFDESETSSDLDGSALTLKIKKIWQKWDRIFNGDYYEGSCEISRSHLDKCLPCPLLIKLGLIVEFEVSGFQYSHYSCSGE